MASYRIEWRKSTRKAIRKIDKAAIPRIIEAVEELATDPRPINSKKLKGSDSVYRIRVGNYRVLYEICDGLLLVEVVKIGHRRDVYQ